MAFLLRCAILAFLFIQILIDLSYADSISYDERPWLLCPGIRVSGKIDPKLDDVEKRLVCGDPEGSKDPALNEAWKTIPFSQARYNLKNFLQERGYHHPIISPKTSYDPWIVVEVGNRTRVSEVIVEGENGAAHIERRRKIIGEPLTPAILSLLEKWVFDRLRTQGFGCPQVKSEDNPDNGVIHIYVNTGPVQNLVSVDEEPIEGMESKALRRYDAFGVNRIFDGDLLTVTDNRVNSTQMVESSRMITRCDAQGVHATEEIIAGSPRLLSVGAGVNTEGLILGKASWKNTRMGRFGSLLDVTASASAKLQALQSTLNWYFLPYVSRYYFNPFVQIAHRNEQNYEAITSDVQFGVSTTGDHGSIGSTIFLGPTLNFIRTFRGSGSGDPNVHLLALENRILIKSHTYEYYAQNPQAGFAVSLITDLNDRNIFSDVSAQRFNLKGQALWNIRDYDPSLWIIGLRGGAVTVITGEVPSADSKLPGSLLQYLGGSNDLRGFGRQTLVAKNGLGALSSAYLGVELRLSNTLPFNFDPFIFTDVGALGTNPASLDSPIYWSPGVGMRWASPVGPLRTTFARGFTGEDPTHWQFYFSFGEEF